MPTTSTWCIIGDYCSWNFHDVFLAGSGFVKVTVGNNFACALKGDGTVWCWGGNDSGQLGNGTINPPPPPAACGLGITTNCAWVMSESHPAPVQVSGLTGVTAIKAAWGNVCALKSDGTAWCWGNNDGGSLGSDVNNGSTYTVPASLIVTGSSSVCSGTGCSPNFTSGMVTPGVSAPACSVGTCGGITHASCSYGACSTTISCSSVTTDVTDPMGGPPISSTTVTTCGFTCPVTYTNTFSWVPSQVTAVSGAPGDISDIAPGWAIVKNHVQTWSQGPTCTISSTLSPI